MHCALHELVSADTMRYYITEAKRCLFSNTRKLLYAGKPEATSIALHELLNTKLTDTLFQYIGKIVGFGSDAASDMTGK